MLQVLKVFNKCQYHCRSLECLDHQTLAPLILGSLGDQSSETHPELWSMVLSFCRRYPDAFDVLDFRKVVQPRLLAMLRCLFCQQQQQEPERLSAKYCCSRVYSEVQTRVVTAHACRNNCHGSAAASLPAILPFSMMLPERLQTSAYYASVMDSVLTGRELATVPADVMAGSNTLVVRSPLFWLCAFRCET